MKFFITFLSFFLGVAALGQVGINTINPHPSSILDVSSTTQGMLTPRLTTAQKNAIASPATGLLVYDIDQQGFSFYNGTTWSAISVTSSSNDYSGWGAYSDTQYTSASPFVIGNTAASVLPNSVTLPNNALSSIESQKPIDITTFYDSASQTITGRNGDGINVTIEFKARPNTTTESRITIAVDIGGSVGEIYTSDFILNKGNDVEHYYLSSFDAYTLGTWQANGGTVKISCTDSTDIYAVRYVITRTHKAR